MTQAASLDPEPVLADSPAPEAAIEDAVNDSPQPDDDETEFIRIPRKGLFPALGKLVEDDAEFAQAARSVTGSRAAREAKAQIETLQSEVEQLRWQLNQQRIQAAEADPETLKERLATDSAFRREYDQLKASQPPRQISAEDRAFANAVQDEYDRLVANLGPAAGQALGARAAANEFGVDSSGRPLSRFEQVKAFARAVDQEIAKASAPSTPEDDKPQGNARLQTGQPDLARNGNRNAQASKTDLSAVIGDITRPLAERRRAYEQQYGIASPF